MEILLGIDVGNTNIKCIAIEPNGNLIKLAVQPVQGYDVGRDASKMFSQLCRTVREVTQSLSSEIKILGVATSSVGCAAVLLDQNKEQVFVKSSGFEKMPPDTLEVTRYPPDYINAGVILINSADDLSQISYVLSLSDYISYRLSGVCARDISTAGSMSMYNRHTGAWWDGFKSITGLTDGVLGDVYASGTQIGAITEDASKLTGIPKGVPVCLGGHDYLCAAFALGCVDEGSVLNVLGTYEMIASFYRHANVHQFGINAFSDCHCYPGRYSLTCEALAGSQLEWLRSNLAGDNDASFWEDIYTQIDALPPSFEDGGREIFIPRIYGECFPVRDSALRGSFFGLGAQTNRAQLMRAAIEGLCMHSRRMLEFVKVGKPDIIIVTGGGSKGRFWIQTKADVLGLPLRVPQVHEASATGAALLAGVGLGVYSGYDEATNVYSNAPAVEYYPQHDRTKLFEQVYNELFIPALEVTAQMDLLGKN